MSVATERPADRWQVLIVEDDPVVASVYQRAVASVARLEVAGIVARGEDALALLERKHCDLMLLDLRLAGMNGVTLLHKLRASGHPIEVIAVTSARSSDAVRAVVQRGAIDYLVKPFTMERLRQSLALFFYRATALQGEQLDQDDVDRICSSGRVARRWLPKGLTQTGLGRIREVLQDAEAAQTATDIAAATGMARVTARRYLEYLVATNQASVDAVAAGPGRPRKVYRFLV